MSKYIVNIHTGKETPHKPKHRIRARLVLDYEFDWEYGLNAARNNVENRHIMNQFDEAVKYAKARHGSPDAVYWCGCRNFPECGHPEFNTEMLGVVEDGVLVPVEWDEHDPDDDVVWPDIGRPYSGARCDPPVGRSVGGDARAAAASRGVEVEWSDDVTAKCYFAITDPEVRVICHSSHKDDPPSPEVRGAYEYRGVITAREYVGSITLGDNHDKPASW